MRKFHLHFTGKSSTQTTNRCSENCYAPNKGNRYNEKTKFGNKFSYVFFCQLQDDAMSNGQLRRDEK